MAVSEAAERERSPVLGGVGCFLVDSGWLDRGGIEVLGPTGRLAAERSRVPVSLILNEAHTLEHGLRGIEAGFNAVMLCSDDRDTTAALVGAASERGVAVEAELGSLPDGDSRGRVDSSHSSLTDPTEAAAFVAATGVDALAVSIGNVHTLEGATATIDLARLSAIRQATEVPLVMHGSSGLPADAVPEAIARGIAKFNVGTVLKRAYLEGLEGARGSLPAEASPHDLVGSHREPDLALRAADEIVERVRALMRLYGSAGQAA